jgi:hypothetical protein
MRSRARAGSLQEALEVPEPDAQGAHAADLIASGPIASSRLGAATRDLLVSILNLMDVPATIFGNRKTARGPLAGLVWSSHELSVIDWAPGSESVLCLGSGVTCVQPWRQ